MGTAVPALVFLLVLVVTGRTWAALVGIPRNLPRRALVQACIHRRVACYRFRHRHTAGIQACHYLCQGGGFKPVVSGSSMGLEALLPNAGVATFDNSCCISCHCGNASPRRCLKPSRSGPTLCSKMGSSVELC